VYMFNCMQLEKFMWHSSVGCWVCYSMFRSERTYVFSGIAWPDMDGRGCYNVLSDNTFSMKSFGQRGQSFLFCIGTYKFCYYFMKKYW
jgi:hypothetical protein